MHEIGHSVGLLHEQNRSDRDESIKVIWPNVKKGLESQFRKENDHNFGVEYDLLSVMQYPAWVSTRLNDDFSFKPKQA